MTRAQRLVALEAQRRKPFFGTWPPLFGAVALLVLGVAAVATFYVSVFVTAHALAAANGASRQQLSTVTLWVCALFILQGAIPLFRFTFSELPRLIRSWLTVGPWDVALLAALAILASVLMLR